MLIKWNCIRDKVRYLFFLFSSKNSITAVNNMSGPREKVRGVVARYCCVKDDAPATEGAPDDDESLRTASAPASTPRSPTAPTPSLRGAVRNTNNSASQAPLPHPQTKEGAPTKQGLLRRNSAPATLQAAPKMKKAGTSGSLQQSKSASKQTAKGSLQLKKSSKDTSWLPWLNC